MGNPTTATATAGNNKHPVRNSSSPSNNNNSSSLYQTATSSHSSNAPQSQLLSNTSPSNAASNSSNKPTGIPSDVTRTEHPVVQSNPIPNMAQNLPSTPTNINEYTKYMYIGGAQPPIVNAGLPMNAPPPNVYPPGMIPMARQPVHAGFPIDARAYGNQPMYFPPRGFHPGRIMGQNNNGMARARSSYFYGVALPGPTAPVPVPTTKPTSTVPANKEANEEFFNLLQSARKATLSSDDKTESPKQVKRPQPQTSIPKTTEKDASTANETSLKFGDLIRSALSSQQPPSSVEKSKPTQEEINGEMPAATVSKPAVSITNEASTTSSSTHTTEANEATIELSNALRKMAHGESPTVAVCEYGLEIDGFKTYTIEEMLAIRSKMTYDVQKMVQTLSKFRIAERTNYSGKSVKLWKTISEKRQLGLVSDKEMFNHSLLQVLNKVTAVNFYQNWATFRSLKFTSSELVVLYAELLYDKVIGEHSWSYVYSELVRISINSFNQLHPNDNYGELFLNTLLACIKKGLTRDYTEEKQIADLKKFTSKDMEAIDKVIAETAERETTYRKKHFGVVLFVANLYYDGVMTQEGIDEIIEQLKNENDTLGVELYVCLLENIALKYVENNQLTPRIYKYVDALNTYVSSHSTKLASRARFAMMDLFKYKQDKFKTLPPKKRVPKSTDASSLSRGASQSNNQNIGNGANDFGNKRSSHMESSSFSRMDRSNNNFNNYNYSRYGASSNRSRENPRFKTSVSDNRRPNPDAFHNPNKGKSFNKPRGMAQPAGVSFNRLQHTDTNVYLDEVNTTIPSRASAITSRTTLDSKPISLLKRQADAPQKVTVVSNNKFAPNKSAAVSTSVSPTTPIVTRTHVTSSSGVPSRVVTEPTSKQVPSQEMSSLDVKDSKENSEIKNLEETAQTLISNFHLNETNVSRFIIELSGYSLSDHMDILLKEAFKYYYSGVSHGHYAFGVLLSELMSRQPQLVSTIKANLADQLIELSLNAIDEPVLWDYFYLTVLPMLSNKRITLDDLHELLAKTPDVMNADETILNMFVFGEKRLSKYDVAKLVAKQPDTKVWRRLVNATDQTDVVKAIVSKLPVVSSFKVGHILHWVDIFLDVNYDATYITQSFTPCYASANEGLKDAAKTLYLYSALGDSFTNDLITIFNKRNKKLMDELFGPNSSQKLLCFLAEIFAMFKFTPSRALVDIGIPLYKNDHVDKEWLNSWREQDDKPYDSSKVDPDIYKIIKSRSD